VQRYGKILDFRYYILDFIALGYFF